ncbi:MAG: AAA family ATPase [Tepidisphaerales bacterium]
MRVIAIINQKGGCGKTTTSINLSACLARLGQRTLLVDLDPQGHCAVGLAVPEEQIERSIFDTLIEPGDGKVAKLSEVVWQIASDFDLAPSTLKLAAFEQLFAGRPGRESRLAAVLEQVRERYKWAILDCPPSVGLITFNALKACDEVIVPVETGYFSLHGLTKMLKTLEAMKEKAGKDVRVRILPNLYDTRTKLAREVLSELRNKFKGQLLESTVNFNTKLKEAASFGQPITEYDPGSRGYKDFLSLARELMGERPVHIEETPAEGLTRPAELVQRAKALASLTNLQFGRNTVTLQPLLRPGGNGHPATGTPGGGHGTAPSGPPVHAATAVVASSASSPVATTPAATAASGTATMVESSRASVGSIPAVAPAASAAAMVTAAPTASMALTAEYLEVAPITETPPPTTRVPKTTEEKLAEFYGVRQMDGEVLFAARFEDARSVQLAGDFNNWSPVATPMRADENGRWVTALPLRPGRYRYRLVVDGQWRTDPANSNVEANQFGELNNVVEVD